MTVPPPPGHGVYRVVWNWNQLGAAIVASEAGLVFGATRDRGIIYSPYGSKMTMEKLREAWFRVNEPDRELPFPRRIYTLQEPRTAVSLPLASY